MRFSADERNIACTRIWPRARASLELVHLENRRDQIIAFHRDGRNRQIRRAVRAIGEKRVSVLEEAHGPAIFFPFAEWAPLAGGMGTIKMYGPSFVDLAGLDHGREENGIPHTASVNGGAFEIGERREVALTIEMVDMVGFQRSVGRKVQPLWSRNHGNGAGLRSEERRV